MERFAADALTAQHEAHVKGAIKSNVPWPDIVEDYGVTLEDIMRIAGHTSSTITTKASEHDIQEAREEANNGRRKR